MRCVLGSLVAQAQRSEKKHLATSDCVCCAGLMAGGWASANATRFRSQRHGFDSSHGRMVAACMMFVFPSAPIPKCDA